MEFGGFQFGGCIMDSTQSVAVAKRREIPDEMVKLRVLDLV